MTPAAKMREAPRVLTGTVVEIDEHGDARIETRVPEWPTAMDVWAPARGLAVGDAVTVTIARALPVEADPRDDPSTRTGKCGMCGKGDVCGYRALCQPCLLAIDGAGTRDEAADLLAAKMEREGIMCDADRSDGSVFPCCDKEDPAPREEWCDWCEWAERAERALAAIARARGGQ